MRQKKNRGGKKWGEKQDTARKTIITEWILI
jgi:hypothetical protein